MFGSSKAWKTDGPSTSHIINSWIYHLLSWKATGSCIIQNNMKPHSQKPWCQNWVCSIWYILALMCNLFNSRFTWQIPQEEFLFWIIWLASVYPADAVIDWKGSTTSGVTFTWLYPCVVHLSCEDILITMVVARSNEGRGRGNKDWGHIMIWVR